jgi:hypothetical protein
MNELLPELRAQGGPPMDVRTHSLIPLIAAIRRRMVGSASRQRTRLPIGPGINDREARVFIRFASESDLA